MSTNTSPTQALQSLPFSPSAQSACEALTRQLVERYLKPPLRDLVEAHLATQGKRIRARLAFAAARALGLDEQAIVGWAVACELLHNASLIHDDIQDADQTRRGQPALWTRFGINQAINAGDALLILPFAALDATPERLKLIECLARRALLTAGGQSLEHGLQIRQCSVSWAHYEQVAQGKSGQFFALPIEGAALIAGLPQAHAIAEATTRLGVLYQILDDLEDVLGALREDPEAQDVRQGRPSALVCLHHDLYPDDAPKLPGLAARAVEPQAFWALLSKRQTLSALVEVSQTQQRALDENAGAQSAPALQALLVGVAAQLLDAIKARCKSHPF